MFRNLLSKAVFARGAVLAIFLLVTFFAFQPTAFAAAGECGLTNLGQCLVDAFVQGIAKIFASIFLVLTAVFSIFLGWAASFFNFAMLVTVYQFSSFFGNTEGLRIAWGILRDLANIILLFGFIFIGVMTILDIGGFTAKKALPMLIIFAVLLNFSLFVAEAVVDVSNAVASTFYAQAGNIDCSQSANDQACANEGMAGKMIEISGLASTFNITGDQFGAIWGDDDGPQQAVVHLGLMALVVIMTGVFIAGSLILVTRAITLVLVFVTSPIGFAAMAIPGMGKYATDWWGRLIDNAIFAPAFVLFMLISIKVLEGIKNSFGVPAGTSLYTVLTQSETLTLGGTMLLFALIIGFMWASLEYAKKASVFGANKISGIAMSAVANTIGGVTTQPFNWVAGGIGKTYGGTMRFARRLTPAPIRMAVGALGGTALDTGIRELAKGATELKLPVAGAKSLEEAQAASKKSRDALDAQDKKGKDAAKARVKAVAISKALKEASSSGNTDDLEVLVNSTSLAQLKETDQLKKGAEGVEKIATVMSSSMFKQAMDDKDITDDVKKKMKDARYGKVKSLVKDTVNPGNRNSGDSKAELAKWSATDIEQSGVLSDPSTRAQAVRAMSDSQYEAIQKSDSIGTNAKKEIEQLREDPTVRGSRFHSDHAAHTLSQIKKPSARAQLPGKALAADHIRSQLRPEDFRAIQVADKLEGDDKQALVAYVRSLAANPALVAYLGTLGTRDRDRFRNYYGI